MSDLRLEAAYRRTFSLSADGKRQYVADVELMVSGGHLPTHRHPMLPPDVEKNGFFEAVVSTLDTWLGGYGLLVDADVNELDAPTVDEADGTCRETWRLPVVVADTEVWGRASMPSLDGLVSVEQVPKHRRGFYGGSDSPPAR